MKKSSRKILEVQLYELGAFFLVCAAFASPWSGLSIGGLQPVDLFLVLSLAFTMTDWLTSKSRKLLQPWITLPGFAIFFVAAFHVVFPASRFYLEGRFRLDGLNTPTDVVESPLLVAAKWIVALVILPLLTSYICQRDIRVVRRMSIAWMSGSIVSSLVSVSDFLGSTDVGSTLVGYINTSGRQSGLSSHPNNLGVACVIAIPVTVYLFQTHRKVGMLSLTVLGLGAFMSGSRGAQAGAVIAFLLALIVTKQTAKLLGPLLALLAVASVVASVFLPDFLMKAQGLLRFQADGVEDSNSGRWGLAQQALTDFQSNPLVGVGLEIVTYAHSVPLQLISAGGVLLATSLVIFWVGALRAGWVMRREHLQLSGVLTISVLAWLAMSVVENQLTDRYLYVPVAVIAALWMSRDGTATTEQREFAASPRSR